MLRFASSVIAVVGVVSVSAQAPPANCTSTFHTFESTGCGQQNVCAGSCYELLDNMTKICNNNEEAMDSKGEWINVLKQANETVTDCKSACFRGPYELMDMGCTSSTANATAFCEKDTSCNAAFEAMSQACADDPRGAEFIMNKGEMFEMNYLQWTHTACNECSNKAMALKTMCETPCSTDCKFATMSMNHTDCDGEMFMMWGNESDVSDLLMDMKMMQQDCPLKKCTTIPRSVAMQYKALSCDGTMYYDDGMAGYSGYSGYMPTPMPGYSGYSGYSGYAPAPGPGGPMGYSGYSGYQPMPGYSR